MMDDPFRSALGRLEAPDTRQPEPGSPDARQNADPTAAPATADAAQAPAAPAASPAQERFRSCRWRAQEGEYCTHRDVLPMAGKEGFNPDAWCPDCAFYKLRRTPKKRDYSSGY
jgi:hypothetical protein